MGCIYLFMLVFFVFFDWTPRSETAESLSCFFFFFEGPPYCFSIVTAPVYDSINNSQEPPFPISLPPVHTAWCQSFWQAWGSNSLWFVFAFPWWLVMLIIFSCVCWNSMCILWKNVHWGSQTTFQFDCFPDFELYQFFIYFAY